VRLADKVALVTGGTRGIGAVMARRFAEQGARVVLTGRSVDAGEQVAESIRSAGGDARFVRADLSVEADARSSIQAAVDAYGRLDLVNNAGPTDLLLAGKDKPLGVRHDLRLPPQRAVRARRRRRLGRGQGQGPGEDAGHVRAGRPGVRKTVLNTSATSPIDLMKISPVHRGNLMHVDRPWRSSDRGGRRRACPATGPRGTASGTPARAPTRATRGAALCAPRTARWSPSP
jgi:hypothetical protein